MKYFEERQIKVWGGGGENVRFFLCVAWVGAFDVELRKQVPDLEAGRLGCLVLIKNYEIKTTVPGCQVLLDCANTPHLPYHINTWYPVRVQTVCNTTIIQYM